MGTPLPRHSTARPRTRLIAVTVVLVVLAVIVAAVLLRPGRGEPDDAGASTTAEASEPAAAEPGAPAGGRTPDDAPTSDDAPAPDDAAPAGDEPLAPPPPAAGDARVAAPPPEQPVGTATGAPVGVGAAAPLADGVSATVRTVTPVQTTAQGPGERAGDGAVVRLEVRNDGAGPVDLSTLTVTASARGETPAPPSSSGVADPLAGPLDVGQVRAGTYVFTLPPGSPASSLVLRVGLAGSATVATVRAG